MSNHIGMSMKKNKIIVQSTAGILYYIVAFFFPIAFFLTSNWREVFENWTSLNSELLFKLLTVFLFFGIPILMIIFQKKIVVYNDRIELKNNILSKSKVYYFERMLAWNIYLVSGYRIITTKNLRIKFEGKKIDINEIESDSFNDLLKFLDSRYSDKKI